MPISLVIADDHPIILDGLEQLFAQEGDFTVVARCTSGDVALKAVLEHRPDVLILDLRMPGKGGLTVLREMRERGCATRAVILTASLDEHDVLEAVRCGARGLVLKEMAPQLVVQCVRAVHRGEGWLERRMLARALDRLVQQETAEQELGRVLTPRELEIVRMVSKGLRNKQIARQLDIAEGTVKLHLHNIYQKTGANGRMALALYAQEKRLV
jgi:DNA-binding NarL/FixJ family response regulator